MLSAAPADIMIVNYLPAYRQYFSRLNYDWISTYFKVEDIDRRTLEDPENYVLRKGGHILFALYNNTVAGTCALLRMPDSSFELAKMAVDPKFRGKGIGKTIGTAAINLARNAGAARVMLLSNRSLTPAMRLYERLGFREVPMKGMETEYERANIKMVLEF